MVRTQWMGRVRFPLYDLTRHTHALVTASQTGTRTRPPDPGTWGSTEGPRCYCEVSHPTPVSPPFQITSPTEVSGPRRARRDVESRPTGVGYGLVDRDAVRPAEIRPLTESRVTRGCGTCRPDECRRYLSCVVSLYEGPGRPPTPLFLRPPQDRCSSLCPSRWDWRVQERATRVSHRHEHR